MAWICLLAAGCLEMVWVTAMKLSDGFTRVGYSVLTVAAMAASVWLLAQAVKTLPMGTAYAVWTGIGVQNRPEAAPQVGEGVLHAGGNLRVDGAGEQSAGLHLPQLGGEDLLGDGADGLFQLPKAFGARHQVSQDQNLPFVADQGQGGFHRTGWARG